MLPLRLGAVSYLNARPLVYALDAIRDQFDVRFDVPARCAALLHDNAVDLGLIPAIEYLRGDYAIVPDVAIASDGDVASVAVFTRKPMADVRSLALDASSRTSVALTRVLCANHWNIAPVFVPAEPDLVIGDPAFEIDPVERGVTKIDLGGEWKAMTGLPFVYAMWVGRPGVVSPSQCQALQRARDGGVANLAAIARSVSAGDPVRERRSLAYLRDNLKYGLGEAERAGLRRFHELAADISVVPELKPLRFYES